MQTNFPFVLLVIIWATYYVHPRKSGGSGLGSCLLYGRLDRWVKVKVELERKSVMGKLKYATLEVRREACLGNTMVYYYTTHSTTIARPMTRPPKSNSTNART